MSGQNFHPSFSSRDGGDGRNGADCLKTPSRPLRASRFTRLLQTWGLPPPCKSAGYAVRRAWFCSRTLPDVLPTDGWHSHSDVLSVGSRHISLNRLGQLCRSFPFPIRGSRRIRSLPRLPVPDLEAASKAHSLHGRAPKPGSLGPCSDTAADPAGLCLRPPRLPYYSSAFPSASGAPHPHSPASPWFRKSFQSYLPQVAFSCGGQSGRRRHMGQQIASACRSPHSRWSSCNYRSPPPGLFAGYPR